MIKTLACLALLTAACSTVDGQQDDSSSSPDYTAVIRSAAADYRAWGVVGPHVLWAPTRCMAPPAPSMHATRAVGLADDGHKLFALYASDATAYLELTTSVTDGDAPVGLTLVKEAYEPQPVAAGDVPDPWTVESRAQIADLGFYPYAKKGDDFYGAGRRKDLFVMTKVAADLGGTDAGWVYGTVSPDGSVTSAGRVESCIECHDNAPFDRLFGVHFDR